jgi:hypothetical protein
VYSIAGHDSVRIFVTILHSFEASATMRIRIPTGNPYSIVIPINPTPSTSLPLRAISSQYSVTLLLKDTLQTYYSRLTRPSCPELFTTNPWSVDCSITRLVLTKPPQSRFIVTSTTSPIGDWDTTALLEKTNQINELTHPFQMLVTRTANQGSDREDSEDRDGEYGREEGELSPTPKPKVAVTQPIFKTAPANTVESNRLVP